MSEFILFEIKRILKSTKYWFVVLIVLLFGIITLQEYQNKQASIYETPAGYNEIMKISSQAQLNVLQIFQEDPTKWGYFPNFPEDKQVTAKILYEDLFAKTNIMANGLLEKDWVKVNEIMAYQSYVDLNEHLENELTNETQGVITKYYGLYHELKAIQSKYQYPKWVIIPAGIEKDQQEYSITAMQKFRYYKWLKDINHAPLDRYSMNSVTFIYHFMNHYLPLIMAILIYVLLYDIVVKDYENGTLKNLYAQPSNRMKLIGGKIIAGLCCSLLAILLPILGISLVYGILTNFNSMNYPVLIQQNTFRSLRGIENTLPFDQKFWNNTWSLGISLFSKFPKHLQVGGMDLSLQLVSLWQFLVYAVVVMTLYILFIVMLNVFVSAIVKQKILAMLLPMVVILVGMGLTATEFRVFSVLNPFRYANPIAILGGVGSVTTLMTVLVLGGYCLLLYGATSYFVRKKDI